MTRPIVPQEIRRIFQGRIFAVNVESITLPRGGRLDAEIVRHPGSAVLIPITDAGTIILVRQYRHAIGRFVWELPAGSLKAGEDPGAAAARECHEEIGLVPSAMEHLGGFFPTPGYCDEEMHFFLASGLRGPTESDPTVGQDEDEDIESKAFSVDEIRTMIATGAIVDLKTVVGITLLQRPVSKGQG
jgi:ADP-ribose pyrophosphatase